MAGAAAPVMITGQVWADTRWQRLGAALGSATPGAPSTIYDALGRMVQLWSIAASRGVTSLDPRDVSLVLGPPPDEVLAILIDCELGRADGDRIYLCGAEEHLQWLDKKKKAGQKGGLTTQRRRRAALQQAEEQRSSSGSSSARAAAIASSSLSLSLSPSSCRASQVPAEALALADRLGDAIRERQPDTREIQPDRWEATRVRWADAMRLAHQRDHRSWEDLGEVLDWSQRDPFWAPNVRSGKKLRSQYDRLRAEMQRPERQGETMSIEEVLAYGER